FQLSNQERYLLLPMFRRTERILQSPKPWRALGEKKGPPAFLRCYASAKSCSPRWRHDHRAPLGMLLWLSPALHHSSLAQASCLGLVTGWKPVLLKIALPLPDMPLSP